VIREGESCVHEVSLAFIGSQLTTTVGMDSQDRFESGDPGPPGLTVVLLLTYN